MTIRQSTRIGGYFDVLDASGKVVISLPTLYAAEYYVRTH